MGINLATTPIFTPNFMYLHLRKYSFDLRIHLSLRTDIHIPFYIRYYNNYLPEGLSVGPILLNLVNESV